MLRLAWLDIKPPHFDEGVNGWFVDQMTRQGFYHYDPANFHGPLHFYVQFVAQTLGGRNLWALRLPVVFASIGCVALVLAFRRFVPERASQIAALAMAVSPGMVFYGRYAIHETWLVFFLLLTVWGGVGLWRDGTARDLWAAGLGVAGLILTKETYVIHAAALIVALPALKWLEGVSSSAPMEAGVRAWSRRDARAVAVVALGSILFFYSGGFLDWPALPGLWRTFLDWARTGVAGATGHEKEWHYWLELMARYEWPALVGFASVVGLARPGTDRLARYLAIYGVAALAAYSLIPYKTPWCLMSLLWPFLLLFGLAADRLMSLLDRWTAAVLTALALALSLAAACDLSFRKYTNVEEPYVYVQTLPEIDKVVDPLRQLAAEDPVYFHVIGHILAVDHHPLAWLLGDFTRISLLQPGDELEVWDAAWLLIDETIVEKVESKLTGFYFKEALRIRGNAAETSVLYLNADPFARLFPERMPEIQPSRDTPVSEPASDRSPHVPDERAP